MRFLEGALGGEPIAAALQAVLVRSAFRAMTSLRRSPAETVAGLDRLLAERALPGTSAALVCGRGAPDGALELCNAGGPAPLRVAGGEVGPVAPADLAAGLFGAVPRRGSAIELARDDFLFLYTRGLSGAEGDGGETYGVGRVAFILKSLRGFAAGDVTRACLDDLRSFRGGMAPDEDLALLCIRRR